jgi:hypothetical protein
MAPKTKAIVVKLLRMIPRPPCKGNSRKRLMLRNPAIEVTRLQGSSPLFVH